MTKHTDEFLRFAEPVTCREYILPRDDKSTDPKSWIQGNTKIGPVLEVTNSYLQSKHGVEITIESVNNDNSHSWVRISHDLRRVRQGIRPPATKTEVFAFASRSKGKAKPKRLSTKLLLFKDYTYSWKNMVFYWNRSWIRSSLPSGKKNKHSSSTRRITARRRWSDQILETERWSSERDWVLSILVWWCMEEQDGRRRRQQ